MTQTTSTRALDSATAIVTIYDLTSSQRAAIRRVVARRNERMADDDIFVSLERGRIVVTVTPESVDAAADEYGQAAFPSQQDVSDAAFRQANAEARDLQIAIGRTFRYDIEAR
jgi:hypothetical protein